MKRLMLILAVLMLMSPVVASANHHAVKIAGQQGSEYLTDAEGKTLYWFTKDSAGMSACSGGCVDKWPLFYRETVAPPAGVAAGDFATITRSDGKKQTTFRGYPLYYWVKDSKAGDTGGDGINGVWFLVDPANFPPQ